MRTSQDGVWAMGDINGKSMFRHSANVMGLVAAADALDGRQIAMDYSAIPHAVYSYPQIASVGMTEAQALEAGLHFTVARAPYTSTAKGEALAEDAGFAKAIIERDSERILGFHIIGPHAPILIQEVVNAMQSGGHVNELVRGVHIHPSLSELIPSVLAELG
jgi:dihydrolipoamide dehydrogenase